MNIYEKLQKSRVDLQNFNCKKSGRNDYSNYDYYELGDFLPRINEVMEKNKLCSLINFTSEVATLTLINSEQPEEQVIFSSPMAGITLKGAHEIQNLGAVQTYLRRYLYMAAFEIVESDQLDAIQGKNNNLKQIKQIKSRKQNAITTQNIEQDNTEIINLNQYKALIKKAIKIGLNDEKLNSLANWKFGVKTVKELSVNDFVTTINNLPEIWDSFLKK